MLCKILNRGASQSTKMVRLARTFGSDVAKTKKTSSSVQKTQKKDITNTTHGKNLLADLKENAFLEYKKYPSHIGHWNPDSPEYVYSEMDEDLLKREVEGYNDIVHNFKNCLKLQEELYEAIERMDRPYLRGTPGVDANVYDEVKDYSHPVEHYYNESQYWADRQNSEDGNQNRYIRNEIYHRKGIIPSNMKRWQQERDERPVNAHFNEGKGYKFDVMTPYEERAPHVADRLGHAYILGDPVDRLFRLERDVAHPGFMDQPFVQTPPVNADADVNFQEGEVVYENVDALEWGQFWQQGALAYCFFSTVFVPYHYFVKNTFLLEHLKEGADLKFFECSSMYFDNYGVTNALLIPMIYIMGRYTFLLTKSVTQHFPSRLQYNVEKDLLFITVPGSLGDVEERVVEMDHLEIAPATFGIGNAFLSANQADGYYTISDLNAKTNYHIRKDAE